MPSLPRPRKIPRRIDGGSENTINTNPKDVYRRQYFEIFDNAIGCLDKRLTAQSNIILKAVESCLLAGFARARFTKGGSCTYSFALHG